MLVTRRLVARLERVEAEAVARDLRRRGDAVVTAWRDGYLTAVPGRPHHCRAHGITLEELSPADITEVVAFFDAHDADAQVQLSAWAPAATVAALAEAGFVPAWVRSVHATVLGAPTAGDDVPSGGVEVRAVEADDLETFLATLLAGFGRAPDHVDRQRAAAEHADPAVGQWLALVDGDPAGAGLAHLVDGDVFLGPMATREEHRRAGVQTALLAARLRWATAAGAATASVTSSPDSVTARNAERAGLSLIQQQVVLRRPRGGPC